MTDKPVKLCKRHKWRAIQVDVETTYDDNNLPSSKVHSIEQCRKCGTVKKDGKYFYPTKMLTIIKVIKSYYTGGILSTHTLDNIKQIIEE